MLSANGSLTMKAMLRVVLVCSASLAAAFAQTVGASLQGTVYDPSGAVVPQAEISIRNVDTGAVRTLVTDEGGRWREPVLLPGDYELRVSATGFQTVLRKGIHLAVGQDAVMDLHLDLGQAGNHGKMAADPERSNLR